MPACVRWNAFPRLVRFLAVHAAVCCGSLLAQSDEAKMTPQKERDLMSHGEFQMKRMLSDRLQMNAFLNSRRETGYVEPSDSIYQWMVRRYAGLATGDRVFWDPTLPQGASADHSTPILGAPAMIRIANPSADEAAANTRFEQEWFGAVFEMHNLDNSPAFKALYARAAGNQIPRDEFIQAAAHLEYLALKRTLDFYHDTWCKWAAKSSFPTDPSIWQVGALPEFDSWLQHFKAEGSKYPQDPFETTYTWATTDYKRYLNQAGPSSEPTQEDKKDPTK